VALEEQDRAAPVGLPLTVASITAPDTDGALSSATNDGDDTVVLHPAALVAVTRHTYAEPQDRVSADSRTTPAVGVSTLPTVSPLVFSTNTTEYDVMLDSASTKAANTTLAEDVEALKGAWEPKVTPLETPVVGATGGVPSTSNTPGTALVNTLPALSVTSRLAFTREPGARPRLQLVYATSVTATVAVMMGR